MSRRSFFGRLGALAAAALAPAPGQGAQARPAVELQRSPLAGFQYYDGDAVWPLLTLGAAVDLVREDDNDYDARAVRVEWQGRKLGYVPRADNAAIAHLLDHGHRLNAAIVALQDTRNPWARIEFAVHLAS